MSFDWLQQGGLLAVAAGAIYIVITLWRELQAARHTCLTCRAEWEAHYNKLLETLTIALQQNTEALIGAKAALDIFTRLEAVLHEIQRPKA